ncbi:MAG: hypothetical protein BWY59_02510 [Verrucomicrobia bacterium ADurb.Bin345]|nr:MAG: hypothetical protein BWY59_02510 [Verrucomicrobia bacterium ADurb.Bin345]
MILEHVDPARARGIPHAREHVADDALPAFVAHELPRGESDRFQDRLAAPYDVVRLLSFRDVLDHHQFRHGAVRVAKGRIDDVVPPAILGALQLPPDGLAAENILLHAPGARGFAVVYDAVAVLAYGIVPDLLDQPPVHEFDLEVGGADVDLPVKGFNRSFVLRPRFAQRLFRLFAGGDVENVPVVVRDVSGLVPHDRGVVVQPAGLAVLAEDAVFLREALHALLAVPADLRGHPLQVVRVHDAGVGDPAAREVVGGVPELADVRRDVFHGPVLLGPPLEDDGRAAHEKIGIAHRCGAARAGLRTRELQLHFAHHHLGHQFQESLVAIGQGARMNIHDAEGSDIVAETRPQRRRRVEADPGPAGDKRVG